MDFAKNTSLEEIAKLYEEWYKSIHVKDKTEPN